MRILRDELPNIEVSSPASIDSVGDLVEGEGSRDRGAQRPVASTRLAGHDVFDADNVGVAECVDAD
jgi:hypothetical protein